MTEPAEDIRHVVAFIAAAYPSPAWPLDTLKLYARMLADVPIEGLRLAAREWVQNSTEKPTVADLRRDSLRCAKRLQVQSRRRRELASTARRLQLEPADPVDVRTLLADCVRRLGGGR